MLDHMRKWPGNGPATRISADHSQKQIIRKSNGRAETIACLCAQGAEKADRARPPQASPPWDPSRARYLSPHETRGRGAVTELLLAAPCGKHTEARPQCSAAWPGAPGCAPILPKGSRRVQQEGMAEMCPALPGQRCGREAQGARFRAHARTHARAVQTKRRGLSAYSSFAEPGAVCIFLLCRAGGCLHIPPLPEREGPFNSPHCDTAPGTGTAGMASTAISNPSWVWACTRARICVVVVHGHFPG